MRKLLCTGFVLSLSAASSAHAGDLYKCADAKGAETIQTDACPAGSTQIWKRDSAPAPQPTLQQVLGASSAPAPKTAAEKGPVIADGVWETPKATSAAAPATEAAVVAPMFPDAPTTTDVPEAANVSATASAPAPESAATVDATSAAMAAATSAPTATVEATSAASEPAPIVAATPADAASESAIAPAVPMPAMSSNNACANAKAFAYAVRDKIWLELSEEQSARLYRWVISECKSDSGN